MPSVKVLRLIDANESRDIGSKIYDAAAYVRVKGACSQLVRSSAHTGCHSSAYPYIAHRVFTFRVGSPAPISGQLTSLFASSRSLALSLSP